MNRYYTKLIEGRWNVIQVIGDSARYFVLKGELENPNPLPFLSHGWVEDEQFSDDGEEFIDLQDWDKQEGILIHF